MIIELKDKINLDHCQVQQRKVTIEFHGYLEIVVNAQSDEEALIKAVNSTDVDISFSTTEKARVRELVFKQNPEVIVVSEL